MVELFTAYIDLLKAQSEDRNIHYTALNSFATLSFIEKIRPAMLEAKMIPFIGDEGVRQEDKDSGMSVGDIEQPRLWIE